MVWCAGGRQQDLLQLQGIGAGATQPPRHDRLAGLDQLDGAVERHGWECYCTSGVSAASKATPCTSAWPASRDRYWRKAVT